MASADAPRYPNIVGLQSALQGNPTAIQEAINDEHTRAELRFAPLLSDELSLAQLFMRTGAQYLQGITNEALRDKQPSNFYPGGIHFSSGRAFLEASESKKKLIRLNFAAVLYGLALETMQETVESKQGLFPIQQFCSRYNTLLSGTAFPNISPEDLGIKLHNGDDGVFDQIDPYDATALEKAFHANGILYLFDKNQMQTRMPKSLHALFRKFKLHEENDYDYIGAIHKGTRKLMRTLRTGRRGALQRLGQQMTVEGALKWYEQFLEDVDLNPENNPPPQTNPLSDDK
ncbi:MAG TPA: hypothetical protein VFQ63_03165 [Patescibacteria group bacterium]|nr:hypothetical protein [Patescibacteria group bacterium]